MFGTIEDVAVGPDDGLYVLDGRNNEVRVFSRDGRFLFSVGSPGRGPGELATPVSLAIDGNGTLYVADWVALHEFRPSRGRLGYHRSTSYSFFPQDICLLRGAVYVHGLSRDTLPAVHLVADGSVVRSFGRIYAAPPGILTIHTSPSLIACSPDPRVIAIAPKSIIGEIHGYLADGTPRWIVVLDDYRPLDAIETGGGLWSRVPHSGAHVFGSLVSVGPNLLLAQIHRIRRLEGRAIEILSVHSLLIDAATGRVRPLGTRLPRVLAVGDGFFVSTEDDPYPRLQVYDW
jgi:hypothetical protein